jgi:hypothetical protein
MIRFTDHEEILINTAIDEHGYRWALLDELFDGEEFESICPICRSQVESGWLCLNTGKTICEDHIALL